MLEKIELTKHLVVNMPLSMHKELRDIARKKAVTLSDFVRNTLRKEIDKEKEA